MSTSRYVKDVSNSQYPNSLANRTMEIKPDRTAENKGQQWPEVNDVLSSMGAWADDHPKMPYALHVMENHSLLQDDWSLVQAKGAQRKLTETDMGTLEWFVLKGQDQPISEKLYQASNRHKVDGGCRMVSYLERDDLLSKESERSVLSGSYDKCCKSSSIDG